MESQKNKDCRPNTNGHGNGDLAKSSSKAEHGLEIHVVDLTQDSNSGGGHSQNPHKSTQAQTDKDPSLARVAAKPKPTSIEPPVTKATL
ncbi:hypothetical protein IFR05_016306, partial [Cadophora sp. M221]